MRANSIFDPQYSVGGHQPRGHDQWALQYGQYLVHGLAYEVIHRPSALDAGTAAAMWGICGVHVGGPQDTVPYGSMQDYMERPRDYGEQYKYWSRVSTTGANQQSAGPESQPQALTLLIQCLASLLATLAPLPLTATFP